MAAAVVLAAGEGRRLGRTKPLLRHGGRTLLRRAVDAARGAGCDPVVVVVGHDRERVAEAAERAGARVVVNVGWREGIAASIRVGVGAVRDAEAVVLLVCDQPALDASVVRRVLAVRGTRPDAIAACEYAGATGTPAAFGAAHLEALADLRGDRGARALFGAGPLSTVPWPEGAVDVDGPDDLKALR